jgi:hypothetical protein
VTPLAYSHSGVTYVLGYGTDFYAIWHRGRLDQPESTYPRTQDGWSQAWSRFSALEPAAATVAAQAGPIARPGSLAAVGPILIVLGVLVLLFGLLILAGSGSVDEFSTGVSQSTVRVLGILTLLQGVLELVAGIRVIGRHKDGRILGIVMATLGALFSLLGILGAVSGGSPAVLLLGLVFISLRIFVLVTLARTGPAFS